MFRGVCDDKMLREVSPQTFPNARCDPRRLTSRRCIRPRAIREDHRLAACVDRLELVYELGQAALVLLECLTTPHPTKKSQQLSSE